MLLYICISPSLFLFSYSSSSSSYSLLGLTAMIADDAIKITSELHDPIAHKSYLYNKKEKNLTESTGVMPVEYTPKVKSELSSQL